MNISITLLSLLATVVGAADTSRGYRQGRQIFQQKLAYSNRESKRYQMCRVGKSVGPCLKPQECAREQGLHAGYCGLTDYYCCIVDKTCGQKTSAHQAYFMNPSYPEKDDEARPCNFQMEIGRKVCAVRLDFERFELGPYEDGVCIRDTLTILGTAVDMPVTPICGNLTSWATTFEVKERTVLTLAMVLQADPPYRFSIIATQLACDHISPFQSPTYSGVRNVDAEKYVPTTTTTEAATETTTDMTETPTELPPTTMMPQEVPNTRSPEDGGVTVTDPATPATPTTLKPGKIPTPSTAEVLIRSLPTPNSDSSVLEAVDSVPAISAFKRAFDLKVDDKCWQYEEEWDTGFRIIGGAHTNLNEYPWQVALVYKKKFFCGGSLISDRHVLTAAHCVFGSFSKGLDLLRVSVGDHDLSTRNETNNQVAKVKSIWWHLHYNPHTTHNDIAIMELQQPVNFTYGISAVSLPTDLKERYELSNATVTGWGRFRVTKKTTSTIMKEYTGPLMNTTKCVAAWNKFPGISASFDQHICLDVTTGTPCHGDSGGPLVVCSGAHCTQVGVVSFGFPMCTNVGLPAVFTRITYYKRWMDINLHNLHYV